MAKYYGIGRGDQSQDITESGSTTSEPIEIYVDNTTVTKTELLTAIEILKEHIGEVDEY